MIPKGAKKIPNTWGPKDSVSESTMANSDDNKAKAARTLEISERTLWYKLKKFGLRK